MEVHPLTISDSLLLIPNKITDERGCFYEAFRDDELSIAAGRRFDVVQANYSISACGVLRGIHGTLIPPGQAKIVTCHRGAVLDVVVDLRLGSPTFGEHQALVLNAADGQSVYIGEGLGHAFLALTDDTCVGYLCSSRFIPGTQLDINPFDPALGIDWGRDREPRTSAKDAAAPTVAEAAAAGLLPTYATCVELYGPLSRSSEG